MPSILLTILVVIAIALLIGIQTVLSKLKSPYWGSIIPLVIFIAAAYTHFYIQVKLSWSSVMIFALPFIWSLEEWDKGRKKRTLESEKELTKMKAKDID